MSDLRNLWVIIPAAGKGSRTKLNIPKQYVSIGKRTVLEWTLLKVLSVPAVRGIVMALPSEGLPSCIKTRLDSLFGCSRDVQFKIVRGGDTRQQSVLNSLAVVPPEVPYIAVHDAARPLVTKALFEKVLKCAVRHGAAIPGVVPTDTLKIFAPRDLDGEQGLGFVHETLDRSKMVAIQTPQIFREDILRESYKLAEKEHFVGTDDSSLVEHAGYKVVVVKGDPDNFKITYKGDLSKANEVLEKQGFIKTIKARLSSNKCHAQDTVVTGFGYDIHPMAKGRPCVLGGVNIPSSSGPLGHSDADVICHAVIDSILGAFAMGDIGKWFPPDDPQYLGISSVELLRRVCEITKHKGRVIHVDITVVAEEPKILPYSTKMKENLAAVLEIAQDEISIKATTAEGLGAVGRKEGIEAYAVATVVKSGLKGSGDYGQQW